MSLIVDPPPPTLPFSAHPIPYGCSPTKCPPPVLESFVVSSNNHYIYIKGESRKRGGPRRPPTPPTNVLEWFKNLQNNAKYPYYHSYASPSVREIIRHSSCCTILKLFPHVWTHLKYRFKPSKIPQNIHFITHMHPFMNEKTSDIHHAAQALN